MSRVALGGTAVNAGMVTRRSGSLAVPISVVFVNIVPPTAQTNHRRRSVVLATARLERLRLVVGASSGMVSYQSLINYS